MSTKTTFKRIALVTVAALGFGLIASVSPASAAETSAMSIDTKVFRAGTTLSLSFTPTGDHTDDGDQMVACITSVPAGTNANSVEVGDCFIDANATLADATTRTMTLGRAGALAAAIADGVVAAPAPRTRATGINVGDSLVGGLDVNGDGDYADTVVGGVDDIAATVSNDYFNVAGSYGIYVFLDNNSDGLFQPATEIYTTGTATVGSTPAALTIVPAATVGALNTAANFYIYATDAAGRPTLVNGTDETVDVTFTALSGTVTGAPSGVGIAIDSGDAVIAGKTYYKYIQTPATGSGTYKVTANFSGVLLPLGTAATSGTITVPTSGTATGLSLVTTGLTKGAVKYSAPTALTLTGVQTQTVYANVATTRGITFQLTGTAGAIVQVVLSGVTDSSASLVAGTTLVTIGTNGTATYSVTPTAVAANTVYTVTAGGGLAYTVNFDPAAVDCTGTATCSISATGIPTGVSKDVAAVGATRTFTVTVKDQFNTLYSNYRVVLTTSSTSRNASKAVVAFTGADGSATVSYTDASTSTATLSDSVNLVVNSPFDATTDLFDFNDVVTIKYSGTLGSLALTGGSTAALVKKRTVVNNDDVDTTSDTQTTDRVRAIVDTLMDVNLNDAATGYAVTYTGTPGVKFLLADQDYTDAAATITVANGTAVFVVSEKPGVQTITATAGGLTKTTTVTFVQGANTERNVTVSVPATGKTTVTSAATATVTDGFGNPVSGVSVTFLRSGGRFISGASTVAVMTDSAGVASADYTAEVAGSVTITAKISSGQALLLADDPVTGFADSIASASAVTAFTANTVAADLAAANDAANKKILDAVAAIAAKAASDKAESDAKIKLLEAQIAAAQAASVAAAEAAADAAAEAIDAGNNANDSANAAAEAADAATAAAQQAGEDAVAAAEAAGAAAVAAAQSAQDAAAEATDAATAATDAANAAAEAADAATAAAQDAADAVAALSVQVTEVVASLKKQITALTNLVIRIQKKVKA